MRSVPLFAILFVACKTNDAPSPPPPLALKGPIAVGTDAPGSLGTWEKLRGPLIRICPGFEALDPANPAPDPIHDTCHATFQGVPLRFYARAQKLPDTEVLAVWSLGVGGDVPCSAAYGAYRELLAPTFSTEDATSIIDALSRSLPDADLAWQGYVFGIGEIRDKWGVNCGLLVESPFRPAAAATPTAPGR